jgi:hypothetical protein
MFPMSTASGRIAVLAVAVAVLVGFFLWSRRGLSLSFFRGVLAGSGLILSFDIVWIHWLFGLHRITNSPEDLVLEPLFVLTGLAFMWFGISQERRARQR